VTDIHFIYFSSLTAQFAVSHDRPGPASIWTIPGLLLSSISGPFCCRRLKEHRILPGSPGPCRLIAFSLVRHTTDLAYLICEYLYKLYTISQSELPIRSSKSPYSSNWTLSHAATRSFVPQCSQTCHLNGASACLYNVMTLWVSRLQICRISRHHDFTAFIPQLLYKESSLRVYYFTTSVPSDPTTLRVQNVLTSPRLYEDDLFNISRLF
jgi:hypothetical protein